MPLIKVLFEIDKKLWIKFKSLAIGRGYKVSTGKDNAIEKVIKGELKAHFKI